ncbi:MAG: polysaccharide biosynthesis protein [Clostridia bacterium]|nr:polysaccharide biosynthesis protein [Clostridia bacterium]
MKKENKNQVFMSNVLIILIAQITVKLLGIIYRLVITNVPGFGDQGNGYYSSGYQIYTLLLAISSVGIPNAISKMTSAKNAVGDYRGAYKIYQTALLLFSIIGITASSILFFAAAPIASRVIHMPNAKYVLMALAPSILFVCLSSVVRGYFVGMQEMKASSRSQILEQVFKCVITIAIVLYMSKCASLTEDTDLNAAFMAAGANLATTLATVLSTIYIFGFYFKRKKSLSEKIKNTTAAEDSRSTLSMFKSILIISIPISLGSIISAINRIVDTATITRGIETAFALGIPAIFGNNASIMHPTLEQLNDEAVRLAGILSKSDTLLNLPIAMNISFATVLVPSISAALARGEKKEASKFVSYSFLISILIIFPCAAGFIGLAKPIFNLLYPSVPYGYDLLQISSIALIFIALNQTISGSLQGIGKVFAPATGLFMGCIAKFILNVILIRQPSIHIYGAPVSSIACQVISFAYGFTILSKNISIRLSLKKYILKPLSCSAVMGVAAWGIYKLSMMIFSSNIVSVAISIVIAVIIYFVMVFACGLLEKEEVEMLPMGNRIYQFAVKVHLINAH